MHIHEHVDMRAKGTDGRTHERTKGRKEEAGGKRWDGRRDGRRNGARERGSERERGREGERERFMQEKRPNEEQDR